MSSTSEKGHAKNVDNFSLLIETCIGFGEVYNPSKAGLKIGNLTTKPWVLVRVLTNHKVVKFAPFRLCCSMCIN